MSQKFILLTIITVIIISLNTCSFALTTLYEKTNEEQISSGVILRNYNRLTDKGFLNINILEVDLEDKYTSIGILNSENGLNTFQTVLEMAKTNESIAAINGDFFGGNYQNGYTVGFSASEGDILTSTYKGNESKDEFATFVLYKDNSAFLDYFNNVITFKKKGSDKFFTIKEFNRPSDNYEERPSLFTTEWGEKSIGSFSYLPLVEIVVKNNKIKEIRYNEEAIEIPKDGYVITAAGTLAEYIKDNFKVGNRVELDIDLDINLSKIKTAISGGAILVKDGEIPNFSANITGSHPRTALGISKDEKILYLITVDGRQKSSIGMTQTELAEFLIEKGIYDALNLDGGASTTMVAQKLGDKNLSIINNPSGGVLRKVTNVLGVFNTSRKSSLSNLIIEIDEENVFVGCQKELKVKGYDKYYNPVQIDIDDIKWSTSGVAGEIKDGKLIAGTEAGTINIIAKKGKVEATISIDILSAPNEISIEPKISYINQNEKVKFNITAKNKNGYYASIKNSELTWKIISGDGEFTDGTYSPKKDGIHLIEVSAGNAKSYALVEVATDTLSSENSSNIVLPKDIKGLDDANVSTSNSGDNVTKIAIYDSINKPIILFDKLKNSKIESALNKNADLIFLTSQNENVKLNIHKPIIKTSSYNKTSFENIDIINIDVSNGGLRNTDYTQWLNLQTDIKKTEKQNILILMKGNLDNFTDDNERKLFIDVMCELRKSTGKNIWIINEGNTTNYSMERGIKYLSVHNKNVNIVDPLEISRNTNYILITIEDNKLIYEIKNVFDGGDAPFSSNN